MEHGVKFLCDRCKTRYSIGDDRVRGKILKIRCKNCANVITVREGMVPDVDSGPGDAVASRAANEPAAPAAAAASQGTARDPLAGLTSKRSTEVDTVRALGRSAARA